jgi:uncharacterized lipoprotein YajG
MKTISTLIACAALTILTGCNSSETKPSATPDTNAPAAQAEAAVNQAVDAVATAAPAPAKN